MFVIFALKDDSNPGAMGKSGAGKLISRRNISYFGHLRSSLLSSCVLRADYS
jgi:hypothetical protein